MKKKKKEKNSSFSIRPAEHENRLKSDLVYTTNKELIERFSWKKKFLFSFCSRYKKNTSFKLNWYTIELITFVFFFKVKERKYIFKFNSILHTRKERISHRQRDFLKNYFATQIFISFLETNNYGSTKLRNRSMNVDVRGRSSLFNIFSF